jgi:hypothetical protein
MLLCLGCFSVLDGHACVRVSAREREGVGACA